MPATEHFWRPLSTMHRVFAASAVVLLAATLLMISKDESRDWKVYQREADKLKVEKIANDLKAFTGEEFVKKEQALIAQRDAAMAALDAPKVQSRIAELEQQRSALQGEADILARESKFKNAERDVKRAELDLAVRDNKPEDVLTKRLAGFSTEAEMASERAMKLQRVQSDLRHVKDELAAIYADRENAQAALGKLSSDRVRLYEQLEAVAPDHELLPEEMRSELAAWKRSFKEWPIINGFNPHHKILYEWPKELQVQLGMARVARMDRCRTCHVNISEFGAGDAANYPDDEYHQPFSSHPHGELFLTSASPHPIDKFGCTICHEGDGSGTAFQTAEHTPRSPGEAEEWTEEHHWHANHFWEYPMFPKQFIESSCIRCHHNVTELGVNQKFGATAPKVYEGFDLIKSYGCFGCHEINGYDGSRPIGPDLRLEPQTAAEALAIANDPNAVAGQMRKVGPSLAHIGSKVTPEFISYWTEDPQRFRPTTKMPRFFNNSNQHDSLAGVLQPVELAGISAYLTSKSQPLEFLSPAEGYEPDIERGKTAFQRRGCLACHSYEGEEFAGVNADFGPNLSNIHEKIKPGPEGFQWLYTWLRNPELHHPRTRMPNLFLNAETVNGVEVDPAADIATFLLQGGAKEFPKVSLGGPSLGLLLDADFTKEEAESLHAPHAGIRILEVMPTGPGSRAMRLDADGKAPVNLDGSEMLVAERLSPLLVDDIILEFNGEKVQSNEQLATLTQAAGRNKAVVMKLFSNGLQRLVEIQVSTPLDDLVRLYLNKALTSDEVDKAISDRRFPLPAHAWEPKPDGTKWEMRDFVKGDEIELIAHSADETIDQATWDQRQLEYIGRRTIARYGCYGCHEVPGFADAKPIGTALQDWGRKDTSKLALEHIEEFLNYHGEPDGSSTHQRVEGIIERAIHDKDVTEPEKSAAFFYESLQHHGRAGFLWQKLREPRSYDYMKIESKGWDERLRMPKFPLNEDQIESIATFVLGLVNDPPPPSYQYRPTGPEFDIIEGERLVDKFNCTGCHVLELPSLTYKSNLAEAVGASRDDLAKWLSSNAAKIDSGEITQEMLAGREAGDAILPEEMRPALATFFTNSERLLAGQLDPAIDIKTGLAKHLSGMAKRASGQPIKEFFDAHPEVLLADPFEPADNADALRMLLKLKPAVAGMQSQLTDDGRAIIKAHGLLTGTPDPEEEDPEFRMYGLDVWETLDIGGRIKLPSSKVTVKETDVVAQSKGRGGDLAHWLVPRLQQELNDVNKAWQASPPPLYKEGIKVQTPWLFRFLKNPEQLRYTTVLRMPRFNMDDAEAQALANYFAAVDGVEYPYQLIPQQEPAFLTSAEKSFHEQYPDLEGDYSNEAWKVLNGPLCVKCHQVGGHPYKGTDPKTDIRGPNLERVEKRLQPDWATVWIFKPVWFTSYTSMPVNFPADKPPFPDLFGGDSGEMVHGIVYSLMNYSRMLEGLGVITYAPPNAPAAEPGATEAGAAAPGATETPATEPAASGATTEDAAAESPSPAAE